MSKLVGTVNGKPLVEYYLESARGVKITLLNFGARVTEWVCPDRQGKQANIVTTCLNAEDYTKVRQYFGCTIGRVGNRIAGGKFTIDGVVYQLATNNGPNNLHGGPLGFDKQFWEGEELLVDGRPAVKFTYLSPDRDQGFPGTLKAESLYVLEDDQTLRLEWSATCDKATPVNMTNHAFFNLKGDAQGTVLDHELQIGADAYVPVDAVQIPTGTLASVAGTPFDFTKPQKIGAHIAEVPGSYDHTFALNTPSSERESFNPQMSVYEPITGRVLEIQTSQPGVQLYTGNSFNGTTSGLGGVYEKHAAFCLETQHFPDAVNQTNFENVIIKPGQKYNQFARYRMSTR